MTGFSLDNIKYRQNLDGSISAEYSTFGCVPVIAEGWTCEQALEAIQIAIREIYNHPQPQN